MENALRYFREGRSVLDSFPLLWQNVWPKQLKGEVSPDSWLQRFQFTLYCFKSVVWQKHHAGRTWQSKAVCLVATRKQRAFEKGSSIRPYPRGSLPLTLPTSKVPPLPSTAITLSIHLCIHPWVKPSQSNNLSKVPPMDTWWGNQPFMTLRDIACESYNTVMLSSQRTKTLASLQRASNEKWNVSASFFSLKKRHVTPRANIVTHQSWQTSKALHSQWFKVFIRAEKWASYLPLHIKQNQAQKVWVICP